MARLLTQSLLNQVTSESLRPFLAVELHFELHTQRMWGGYGTIDIDGNDFLGVGTFASIGVISETTQNQATGLTLSLSGIPSDMIGVALKENYQGNPCNIFLGCLDENHNVITSPYKLFSGKIDLMTIQESADSATITVSVENRLIDLEKPRVRRYTPEDQKIDLPFNVVDKGFDEVASVQNKEILWGS